MAAVPMSYRATLYDLANKRQFEVFLEGDAFLTGLGVGGGPLPGGPGRPPGQVWPDPGPLPHPEHPIAPGGRPPGIWGGPIDPYPGHPLPEPPGKPPEPISPPVTWKAVWHPVEGWIVVGVINPEIPHPVPSGS